MTEVSAPQAPLSEALPRAFAAALPVMLGYVSIGLPCGILGGKVGMAPWMCLLMSYTYYSGAGQFMIPNLWMGGASLASIIASTGFVNTRQVLYAAAFAPYFTTVDGPLAFLFSASVTDESFAVNLDRFEHDPAWDARSATLVNFLSCSSWAWSNFLGALIGEAIAVPTALASFAMTAIFVCLLVSQRMDARTLVVVGAAFAGVFLGKLVGLGGASILFGALVGVAAGVVVGPQAGPGAPEGSGASDG